MIDSEKIQAFLDVVEYGNISAAANAGYVTQSHLSKQIRLLEAEVGTQLIIRSKGHSKISLTPHGRKFLETARQWESNMKELEQVRFTESITEVSIGTLDRINNFTLRDFYRSILDTCPDIRLDCHTRHSKEIFIMMENQQLDLGIASALYPVYSITAKPVYTEKMFLICAPGTELAPEVRPEDLDPDQEIYSRWSEEFEIWHNQMWPGKQYRIHVGTSGMTPHYLNKPGRWSIVPDSVLHGLRENCDFSIHTLTVPCPAAKLFLLEQKQPRPSRAEAIAVIKERLADYLKNENHLKP